MIAVLYLLIPIVSRLTDAIAAGEAALVILAQAGGGGAGDAGFVQRLFANPLILPVGLLFIFYLTFIGPERRRKAEEAKMMAALKKNDRVVTVGGIHGTVVAAASDSDVVTVRIDENSNTRVKVSRSAIARVVDPASETKDKTAAAAAKE